jgi:hypothetical protein
MRRAAHHHPWLELDHDAQACDANAPKTLLDSVQKLYGDSSPAKGRHDTNVGDVAEAVGVRRFGDVLSVSSIQPATKPRKLPPHSATSTAPVAGAADRPLSPHG